MKQDEVIQAAGKLGAQITEEQAAQLLAYSEVLGTLGVERGVIAAGDADRVWERHVLDSLRAVPEVQSGAASDAPRVLDLGSGGGLPGIPLAIALPQVRVGLVERRSSKAAFLELAEERVGLTNVDVLGVGTEKLDAGTADVCTARAFARPEKSWDAARRLLKGGGRLIYFAGKGFEGVGDLPGMARCELRASPMLETSGPLVIMTRK